MNLSRPWALPNAYYKGIYSFSLSNPFPLDGGNLLLFIYLGGELCDAPQIQRYMGYSQNNHELFEGLCSVENCIGLGYIPSMHSNSLPMFGGFVVFGGPTQCCSGLFLVLSSGSQC